MKITTDYVVGNTAIQIVNTGRKVKVIDVEKERKKRYFARIIFVTLLCCMFFLGICFYIVNRQSTSVMLEQQNYSLKREIESLEQENAVLAREVENVNVDYKELYKKAKELGMKFPSSDQVYEYDAEKSTAVRIIPVSE